MKFSDLEKSALQLNELYEQLEIKRYGRIWTTEELVLGFVGDMGDLAKLIQASTGIRNIDDCEAKLGHELSDCLWSIIVLAKMRAAWRYLTYSLKPAPVAELR